MRETVGWMRESVILYFHVCNGEIVNGIKPHKHNNVIFKEEVLTHE